MSEITTISQAEEFIFNYNWYESLSRNQEEEIADLEACEALALQNNHKRLLCATRAYITSYYTQSNDLKRALDIGLENYEVCKEAGFTDEMLKMMSFLIQIYQILGNYSQAEVYINSCKEHALKLNDVQKLCNIHILSANQYYYTGDMDKCIAEHEQALKYAQKLNDAYTLITIYNNFAYHIAASDKARSEIILNEGMQLINEQLKQNSRIDFLLGHYYLNYAQLYDQQQRTSEALSFSQKAIDLFHRYNIVDSALEARIILASCYLQQGEFSLCLEQLQTIEATAKASYSNAILLKCYKLLHEYYERTGDFKLAYGTLKKYLVVRDETYNQESEKTIRNLQISYEVKTIVLEKENVERIAKLKHDFLANMSHEIRTPVNSIIGICYLLQQNELTEKQQNYINRLEYNGENLLGIINDILDISKIEAGKLDLVIAPSNLAEVVENVCEVQAFQAAKKNIRFIWNLEELPQRLVFADSLRLTQVFTNLLSNAIKFTPQGEVSLKAFMMEDNAVHSVIGFKVTDTGIGISAEKLDRIFERYEQANAKIHTQFGGTGLGLSISRKLIEMMDGAIEIHSKEGKGSEFIVKLNFEYTSDGIYREEDYLSSDLLHNKKILIADDTDENREVLKEILLNACGDTLISEANNGIDVMEKIESCFPDVILMDLDMPRMNGFETVEAIRRKYADKLPKIIVTTASLLTISKEEILDLGFNDLLLKPIKPQILINAIIKQLD